MFSKNQYTICSKKSSIGCDNGEYGIEGQIEKLSPSQMGMVFVLLIRSKIESHAKSCSWRDECHYNVEGFFEGQ